MIQMIMKPKMEFFVYWAFDSTKFLENIQQNQLKTGIIITGIKKQHFPHSVVLITYILYNFTSLMKIDYLNLEISDFDSLTIEFKPSKAFAQTLVKNNWKWTEI